jgi:Fe2+ or Zn2+ uptake regulation protein
VIENTYGKAKQIICDNCGDGFETEDWAEAQRIMKEEGWKTRKVNGEYVQYCPECEGKS